MQLSAIYPHEFGVAVAQVLVWLRTSCDITIMTRFASNYAACLPSAHDALLFAHGKAKAIAWNDVDEGWDGIQQCLLPKPDRALVKQALRRRKLALETAKKPLFVEESEQESSDAEPKVPGLQLYQPLWGLQIVRGSL